MAATKASAKAIPATVSAEEAKDDTSKSASTSSSKTADKPATKEPQHNHVRFTIPSNTDTAAIHLELISAMLQFSLILRIKAIDARKGEMECTALDYREEETVKPVQAEHWQALLDWLSARGCRTIRTECKLLQHNWVRFDIATGTIPSDMSNELEEAFCQQHNLLLQVEPCYPRDLRDTPCPVGKQWSLECSVVGYDDDDPDQDVSPEHWQSVLDWLTRHHCTRIITKPR
jgi:hypothetical protein